MRREPSDAIGPSRLWRRAVLALVLAGLAGCGPATSFQGISLTSKTVAPELRALAERAAGGDKWSQFELGMRFEQGRGVPMDWSRAERLYRLAATSTGGTMMIYVPPVRPGGSGRVMPVSAGPRIAGLPQAQARLEALRKRRRAEGAPRRI